MFQAVNQSKHDTVSLTNEQSQALVLALLRGQNGSVGEDELERQFAIVETWVRRVEADVAAIALVLNGSVDLSVSHAGEVKLILHRRRREVIR